MDKEKLKNHINSILIEYNENDKNNNKLDLVFFKEAIEHLL